MLGEAAIDILMGQGLVSREQLSSALRKMARDKSSLLGHILGEALGQEFVSRNFSPELKEKTLMMTRQIEDAMAARITALIAEHGWGFWAVERKDGGRGFGFTGGHHHASWQKEDQRKLVLNAIIWLAKVEVPAGGVVTVRSPGDLGAAIAKLVSK